MATSIYLGNPPENIKKWIMENVQIGPKLDEPLTFTAVEKSSITLNKQEDSESEEGLPEIFLEYSIDNSDFIPYSLETTINLNKDQIMKIRAVDKNDLFSWNDIEHYQFVLTGKIMASGNIQTLLDKSGQRQDAPIGAFACLFSDQHSLLTAPELPATTVNDYSYYGMFSNTSLTQTPKLPALTDNGAYEMMFLGCQNLTLIPHKINSGSFSMFENVGQPLTFLNNTFDEVCLLIQNDYILNEGFYDNEGEPDVNKQIEIICSDKTMLVSFNHDYEWIITEK